MFVEIIASLRVHSAGGPCAIRPVHDLRMGRTLRPATEARVLQFIESLEA